MSVLESESLTLERQNQAMKRLVGAVQELSLARSLNAVMVAVRRAARELTGADGATFVLRDGDQCLYAEEDAISPLWKGQRFPMSACISGWVMLKRQAVVIEDIYADPRIPADAYRPTFVKSLVMVPVRTREPVAAIGNYWAVHHRATPDEVELLQALANTTAVALEAVQLFGDLEQRVRDRTRRLREANEELEAFSYSVSHDLRGQLQQIGGFADLLTTVYGSRLDAKAKNYLDHILEGTEQMGTLISDLLRLARLTQGPLVREPVSLSAISAQVVSHLKASDRPRAVELRIEETPEVEGDPGLLRVALENLLSNAWKYSAEKQPALIEFGSKALEGETVFFVRDNGAGFEMRHANKLFAPFQRLHHQSEFPGNGIGLATVRRIIHRHAGRIWAEAEPEKGATFYFTLGPSVQPS